MIKYKFIDERNIERYDKNYIIHDGKQISYPSDEILLMEGTKPLVVDEHPEHDSSKYRLVPYYEDTDTHIIKKWAIEEIPEEELILLNEDGISDEEFD